MRPAGVAAEPAQSLVVVGPTQSGKTTSLAVPAILGWHGPVVAASVKSDLLRDTLGACARRGRVWCIDPTGCTGVPADTWSPLTGCGDWRQACRVAADLCEAARVDGTTADGEFWYATAAKLLAPLLLAAALDRRTMADVVRWVDTQEVGEVAGILERRGAARGPRRGPGHLVPRRAHAQLGLHHGRDGARALRPRPAGAAATAPFEPRLLLGGPHTLYLCAPAHDQRRLRGYFTALTQQVLGHAFTCATRSGPLTRRCWSCSTRRRTSRRCPSSTGWPQPARRTGSSS